MRGYSLQVSNSRAHQQLQVAVLDISNALLVTAVHVKMELVDNTLNIIILGDPGAVS